MMNDELTTREPPGKIARRLTCFTIRRGSDCKLTDF
jgi:hypothetical protein